MFRLDSSIKDASNESPRDLMLSVIIPCLDNADTLAECIETAKGAVRRLGVASEIIVADNGSEDESLSIARGLGAKIVHVAQPGYGSVLIAAGTAAQGRYLFIADGDGRFDFRDIPRFVAALREGSELVQGRRVAGLGQFDSRRAPKDPGSTPLSRLIDWFFGSTTHDVCCGMRAMSRDFFRRLQLQSSGVEVAVELAVKAANSGCRVTQQATTLREERPTAQDSLWRRCRAAWRNYRFLLLMCPQWLFMFSGYLLMMVGVLGFFAATCGMAVQGLAIEIPLLWLSAISTVLGFQSLQFGVFANAYAAQRGLLPQDETTNDVLETSSLGRGLVLSGFALLGGSAFLALAFRHWQTSGFGSLNSFGVLSLAVPGWTLAAIAVQTVIGEFVFELFKIGAPAGPKRSQAETIHPARPSRFVRKRVRRPTAWEAHDSVESTATRVPRGVRHRGNPRTSSSGPRGPLLQPATSSETLVFMRAPEVKTPHRKSRVCRHEIRRANHILSIRPHGDEIVLSD